MKEDFLLDERQPTIVNSKGNKEANLFDVCNEDAWTAPEGSVGKDAEIVLDMKCPIKLHQIQVTNGAGDFSTKGFTVSGSHSKTGPWSKLYTGEMELGDVEV